MSRVAAVVLAAGRGGRLGGVAKAGLVTAAGTTFLDAIVATARAAGAAPIVVVAAEPYGAETAVLARRARVDAVANNPEPERGMLSSFVVALDLLAEADDVAAALLWPVDHGEVASATVAAVVARASGGAIVVPSFGGRGGHPTAFGRELWDELRAFPEGGAREVVRRDPGRVVRLAVEDPGVVRDVDTPDDLASR